MLGDEWESNCILIMVGREDYGGFFHLEFRVLFICLYLQIKQIVYLSAELPRNYLHR